MQRSTRRAPRSQPPRRGWTPSNRQSIVPVESNTTPPTAFSRETGLGLPGPRCFGFPRANGPDSRRGAGTMAAGCVVASLPAVVAAEGSLASAKRKCPSDRSPSTMLQKCLRVPACRAAMFASSNLVLSRMASQEFQAARQSIGTEVNAVPVRLTSVCVRHAQVASGPRGSELQTDLGETRAALRPASTSPGPSEKRAVAHCGAASRRSRTAPAGHAPEVRDSNGRPRRALCGRHLAAPLRQRRLPFPTEVVALAATPPERQAAGLNSRRIGLYSPTKAQEGPRGEHE